MRAIAGDDPGIAGTPSWSVCESVYECGSTFETDAGNELLRIYGVERARAALSASGYRGERAVVLIPSDYPTINAMSLVTADLMKRVGFDVDAVSTDWGTVTQRRASEAPVEHGGWSVFHSTWSGSDVQNPGIHQNLRANGQGAWFGWPTDPEIERLRDAFLTTADPAEQKKLADAIQVEAFRSVPFIPLGYYWQPSAWRRSVTGTFRSHVTAFWNIGKTA